MIQLIVGHVRMWQVKHNSEMFVESDGDRTVCLLGSGVEPLTRFGEQEDLRNAWQRL